MRKTLNDPSSSTSHAAELARPAQTATSPSRPAIGAGPFAPSIEMAELGHGAGTHRPKPAANDRPRAAVLPASHLPPDVAALDAAERGAMHEFTHPFPATLGEYDDAVRRELSRPVDTTKIAEVLNLVRTPGLDQAGETHEQALARATKPLVDEFMTEGVGLRPAEWAKTQQLAANKGVHLPWSSTLGSIGAYSAPSILKFGFKVASPWLQAAGSAVMAGVVQPVVGTLAQTPIVAALDTRQKKLGHAVAMDGAVNTKLTPEQISAQKQDIQNALQETSAIVQHAWREAGRAYGIAVPYSAPLTRGQENQVRAAIDADPNPTRQADQRERLQAASTQHEESRMQAKEFADTLRMSVGMHRRIQAVSDPQKWARTLRAASPMAGVAVSTLGKALDHNWGGAPATTASLLVAGGALAWQHFQSGKDELQGGMLNDVKLNMLYGKDFLTAPGQKALKAGQPIQPEHVIADKVRQLAPGPALQMLSQVTKLVEHYGKAPSLSAAKAQEFKSDLDILQGAQEQPPRTRLQDLSHQGAARQLLGEVMAGGPEGHPWLFAAREGWKKMDALEVSVQGIKRTGAAWRGGALGNVGVTSGARVMVAAAGGADKAHPAIQFGAGALATAAGYHLATHQYEQDNMKNERRAAPDKISARRQAWNAVGDLGWQGRQYKAAKAALDTVNTRRPEDGIAARGAPTPARDLTSPTSGLDAQPRQDTTLTTPTLGRTAAPLRAPMDRSTDRSADRSTGLSAKAAGKLPERPLGLPRAPLASRSSDSAPTTWPADRGALRSGTRTTFSGKGPVPLELPQQVARQPSSVQATGARQTTPPDASAQTSTGRAIPPRIPLPIKPRDPDAA